MPNMCPRCGWGNIRKCIEPHFYDRMLRLLFLATYRCRTCRYKFVWLYEGTKREAAAARVHVSVTGTAGVEVLR